MTGGLYEGLHCDFYTDVLEKVYLYICTEEVIRFAFILDDISYMY